VATAERVLQSEEGAGNAKALFRRAQAYRLLDEYR
jgi:hypothetical protein